MSVAETIARIQSRYGPNAIVRGAITHCLYLIRNLVNNKVYVGKTTSGRKHRLEQHQSLARSGKGYRLHAAIRKYGWKNFEVVWLGSDLTRNGIDHLEKMCIELFRSHDREYGYNSTLGGDGGKLTPEARAKIAAKATGRKLSEETKHKIRLAHLGKKETPEVRASLSRKRKGIKHPRHKESMKLVWQRPGFREKMVAKMIESHARRKAENVA